jgi:hypothetical protein
MASVSGGACLPYRHLEPSLSGSEPQLTAAMFCFCDLLPKTESRYEVWGPHSCVSTDSSLVPRDFVSLGEYCPTFRIVRVK